MSNSSDMDFAEASAAYEAGEFKKAFDVFLRLATENDDPSAMSMVATMYGDGDGVPFDLELAQRWGRKAAEQGITSALINLGILYRARGDLRAAKVWFEKALEGGDGEGALELAKLFLVSDLERERVRYYLHVAIGKGNLSKDSHDQVLALLSEFS